MKTYEYFFHCDVASAGGGEVVSVVAQLLVQRNSHGGGSAGDARGGMLCNFCAPMACSIEWNRTPPRARKRCARSADENIDFSASELSVVSRG